MTAVPSLLTVAEVAERYRVSERTVYRWYKTGRLRPIRIGREWLLPSEQTVHGPVGAAAAMPPGAGASHVLALAGGAQQVAKVWADLFECHIGSGARMFCGRWHGTQSEADVDLADVFRSGGSAAVVNSWRHQIAAAEREARMFLGIADPDPECCGTFETLLEIEAQLDQMQLPSGRALCVYRCDQLSGQQLNELLGLHNEVLVPAGAGWRAYRRDES